MDYPHMPTYAALWIEKWRMTNSHKVPLDDYCAHCGILLDETRNTCPKCGENICPECDPKDHGLGESV